MNIKTVRQAVCKNHGGFGNATDAQIMKLWNMLSDETRKRELQSVKDERKKSHAVSHKS